jgi:hypothetical protein
VEVEGENRKDTPVSLENYGNLYLSKAQGWVAQGGDLSALPLGKNTFSGVQYTIRDFKTSPLESGVTLKHPILKSNASAEQIQGIAINDVADSLFFLHTFLETKAWQPNWQSKTPPALFQYIIHYEDGITLPVVVTLNESVNPWLQSKEAPSLPKAEIAWRGPSADTTKQKDLCPTVYQFQWNNPKPSVKILSIDFSYAENGKDFGAPVLLGVTSAKVID